MSLTTEEAAQRAEAAASVHDDACFWATAKAVGRDASGILWFAAWCVVAVVLVRLSSLEAARGTVVELFPKWIEEPLAFPFDGVEMDVAALRDPSLTEVAGVRVLSHQLVALLEGIEGRVIVQRIARDDRESLWITTPDGSWRAGVTRWNGALPTEGNECTAKGGA